MCGGGMNPANASCWCGGGEYPENFSKKFKNRKSLTTCYKNIDKSKTLFILESDNKGDPYFTFDTKEQRNRVTLMKMGWKPPTSLPSDNIVQHLN
jgi:hypothetical protein